MQRMHEGQAALKAQSAPASLPGRSSLSQSSGAGSQPAMSYSTLLSTSLPTTGLPSCRMAGTEQGMPSSPGR